MICPWDVILRCYPLNNTVAFLGGQPGRLAEPAGRADLPGFKSCVQGGGPAGEELVFECSQCHFSLVNGCVISL